MRDPLVGLVAGLVEADHAKHRVVGFGAPVGGVPVGQVRDAQQQPPQLLLHRRGCRLHLVELLADRGALGGEGEGALRFAAPAGRADLLGQGVLLPPQGVPLRPERELPAVQVGRPVHFGQVDAPPTEGVADGLQIVPKTAHVDHRATTVAERPGCPGWHLPAK